MLYKKYGNFWCKFTYFITNKKRERKKHYQRSKYPYPFIQFQVFLSYFHFEGFLNCMQQFIEIINSYFLPSCPDPILNSSASQTWVSLYKIKKTKKFHNGQGKILSFKRRKIFIIHLTIVIACVLCAKKCASNWGIKNEIKDACNPFTKFTERTKMSVFFKKILGSVLSKTQ